MRFRSLDAWLRWQECLHPEPVDLGLARVGRVAQRVGLSTPRHVVVTVGGTNGKGSSVALLESILRASGYRVGAYTSPHLLDYRERIRVNGVLSTEEALCGAFDRIDRARGETTLSYFEFGTLAAMLLFESCRLDVALLEVGLGGRLDAVNIQAPDVALITSIGMDHERWLGNTRESIGREKAGIMRPGRPAVCGDPQPPESLLEHARAIGARLHRIGHEFNYELRDRHWDWRAEPDAHYDKLPRPSLAGDIQVRNAAGVLMVLELLRTRLPVDRPVLERALRDVQLPGRFQQIPGSPNSILDVAHNPDGVRALADQLRETPVDGKTIAVMGVLSDKDLPAMLPPLQGLVAAWHVAPVASTRSRPAADIVAELHRLDPELPVSAHPSVAAAFEAARGVAGPADRIVVFGSFHTVAEVLALPV